MFTNSCEDLKRYCAERGYGDSPSFVQKTVTVLSSPSFWAITHHRFGFWVSSMDSSYKNPVKLFLKLLYFIGKYLVVCFAKVDILSSMDVGPGLFLSNRGNIIIGLRKLGAQCSIQHNVTIGHGAVAEGLPILGDNVSVGHDSLVYGSITVGDDVSIGDYTVVSRRLPDGIKVQGNPCKIIKPRMGSKASEAGGHDV